MSNYASHGRPLSADGLQRALALLEVAPAVLWSVLAVETGGCGYLKDRRPKLLFERHLFSHLTGGRFDATHPDISSRIPGGYGAAGAHQYDRLAMAESLAADAALQSASWGLGQILGENHSAAGYPDARAMVDAFVASEDNQLLGMAHFVASSPMKAALKAKDWAGFARRYNGPNYAANHYDAQLAAFCARFNVHGCPDLNVRAAQAYLGYRGFDPGGVDGLTGPHTSAALKAFQQGAGLPITGAADPATLQALAA